MPADTPHPKVARPRVPIRKLDDGTYLGQCRHCPWEQVATIRAAIEPYAGLHRHQHAAGQIEVTRA